MDKRTLLFLAMSFLLLGFYPVVLQHFYPEYYKTSKTPDKKTAPAVLAPKTPPLSVQTFSAGDDLAFQNNCVKLLFNKKGGSIHEVSFPKFVDYDTHEPLVFLSLKEIGGNVTLVHLTEAHAEASHSLTPDYAVRIAGSEIRASATQDGVQIQKSVRFKADEYSGDLRIRFENTTDSPIEFNYQLFAGASILPRHSIDGQYIEGNFFSRPGEKDLLQHIHESKLGKNTASSGRVDWVAIKDRHFAIALKPQPGPSFTGLVQGLGNNRFSVSLVSERITLAPRALVEHDFIIYLGPNELKTLAPAGLEAIVNFGKLDAIGRLLVGVLEMLHKLFKNYGVAIIVLTVLINILLFPLTQVSYLSMRRMQIIQPQMNKLKEQHKKNPEKLNKEMMELYKKHKVNPFGGCLPMILQTPVFIALYVALSKSAILINEKLLWIQDLSSPDRVTLPFSLPFLGNEIHVLPLVMCAAMFFQQKLTQVKIEGRDSAMESQQKMMAWMMPVMFGFIFYSMPSALVIYWLTNTLIMGAYQLYLKRATLT
ncbi:MAG: hypothetical protein COT00_04845 [Candidatus Omnitrophica bacterium CG07_land_8_20_14_0_80_50_8]|nr:MAG: hypothetical protein AUJ71_01950 [Candidatus Omnitrophica bacterium CG1_02_49_16]PIU39839.1 MAG: hypothetical protein COT00_04845 [Candidatus Omnitrophica bacterium CG07_land_8_20_14_0_80_50_8]